MERWSRLDEGASQARDAITFERANRSLRLAQWNSVAPRGSMNGREFLAADRPDDARNAMVVSGFDLRIGFQTDAARGGGIGEVNAGDHSLRPIARLA